MKAVRCAQRIAAEHLDADQPAAALRIVTPRPDREGSAPVLRSGEAQRGPVGHMQSKLATALKAEQEWEEF